MLKLFKGYVLFMLILGVVFPRLSPAGEQAKATDKKTRKTVSYVLTIDAAEGLEDMLSQPIQKVQEKLLEAVEKKNDIEIDRTSMVRTEWCLRDLFMSIPHLAKLSVGNTIARVAVELNAGTSQKSVWTGGRSRKLEAPELKMKLFYANPSVEPTEIVCSGYKYH